MYIESKKWKCWLSSLCMLSWVGFCFWQRKNGNKYFEEDMMFGAKEIFACLAFISTLWLWESSVAQMPRDVGSRKRIVVLLFMHVITIGSFKFQPSGTRKRACCCHIGNFLPHLPPPTLFILTTLTSYYGFWYKISGLFYNILN